MVILLKNRAAIYQREAAEMLHNISLYPGLTEEQLFRFFPEKEATAKVLLSHMLKEGRIFYSKNGRYYANREAQNGADKDLSRCVWVLLDFIDQVEYHTVGEVPTAILCFANGELYEIVPIPQGKETMICQLLRQPQKDAGKRIVVVDDVAQIELLDIPRAAGFCTVAEDGNVSYYKEKAALESSRTFESYPLGAARTHRQSQKAVRNGASAACARPDAVCQNCGECGTSQREKHGASAQYVLFRVQRTANLLLSQSGRGAGHPRMGRPQLFAHPAPRATAG